MASIKSITVYFTPSEIGRNLNRDDLREADKIESGLLEQVLPDLICFHSVKPSELPKVLSFIKSHFGISSVEICDCVTVGSMESESNFRRIEIESMIAKLEKLDAISKAEAFCERVDPNGDWSIASEVESGDLSIEDATAQLVEILKRWFDDCNGDPHYAPIIKEHLQRLGASVEVESASASSAEAVDLSNAPRLADLVPLSSKITVYVPSTVDVDKPIDNSAEVERVARLLSECFGGATSTPCRGYWVSDGEKKLVAEGTVMVFAYAEDALAEKYIDDVVRLCYELRVTMKQDAVALEYNGKMYFI